MKNEELRMKKLLKKTLKLILPVVLGGFILFWVYRDFDFTKAGDVLLHGTNWWWMLFSLVFGVFAQVFRGWRWRQTLEPLDAFPKKSDCVNAIFISYAASLVVPRIGEVSRCGVLAKYDNVSFAKSLGTVVTERLVDTLTILLITGITVLLQLPIFVTFLQQTGTKIPSLVHLLTSVWFYIILFCFIGVAILLYYLRKTLFFYERVKGFVLNIWEGIMSLRGVRNIPLFIFYTLAIWTCYFLHFYFTFYCFAFTAHLGIGHVCGRYVCRDCAYSQRGGAVAFRYHFYDDALWSKCDGCRNLCPDCTRYSNLSGCSVGHLWICRSAIHQ